MQNIIRLLICIYVLTACSYLKKNNETNVIARVNQSYLYTTDLNQLLPPNTSKTDSIQIVTNFINNWATQQLLINGATINLPTEKQNVFNKLIQQYKDDLYSKAYLEVLVKKNMDTLVSNSEIQNYYNQHKNNFKLNENLIQFRYIQLDPNRLDLKNIIKKFKQFNSNDKKDLDSISIQFKSYSLNDSIWLKASHVTNKIPVFNTKNKTELLKKSNFIQLKDSLSLYLMQIKDVQPRNEVAPLEYVRPTIKQIVINRRKLELIKKLKKDITKDAIKNKQFEIFN